MVRRAGNAKTISVVVPRHGTPTASHGLMKAVATEVKKNNRVFQEQDQISATELQGLEDASNWNGLLLNARGERGPQWDVTSQMHHVDFGSEEYFNPQLLQEESIPTAENDTAKGSSPQQDVNMPNTIPTHPYPQQHRQEGMRLQGPPSHGEYPSYGQVINGSYPRSGPGGENMGGNSMYPQHPQHPQHPMHARMGQEMAGGMMPPQQQQHMYGRTAPGMDISRHQPQQHHGVPIGGLSYNNHAGHQGQGHGMDPTAMGMGGSYGGVPQNAYGHGPSGMPTGGPHYHRGGLGANGSYSSIYPS